MPNTFMMQELIRTAVDEYMDSMDTEKPFEQPVLFTIPKGMLLRDFTGQS
jgi:hypothetical protein